MKKKFMMVAVLLGALTLGACVDDNESASVTAVREAKAEQLQSIAEMNRAEAEAKIIYAEAEAQLKAAEAALQQALADKAAAEAKIAELEAQMAQDTYDAKLAAELAAAEQARLAAEAAIAKIKGELQYYQMDLEKRIAELQKDLLQAQMDLQNKQDDIASQEMARLEKLAKNYSTLLYSTTQEKQNLAQLKADKLELEADLADWKVEKEQSIAENNAAISLIDKQIALYKEYENYTENVDALQDELELKQAEYSQAIDKRDALAIDYDKKNESLKKDEKLAEAKEAIEANELIKMYYDRGGADYNYERSYWGWNEEMQDFEIKTVQIFFGNKLPIKKFIDTEARIERDGYEYSCKIDSIGLEIEVQDLRQLEIDVNDELANLSIKALEDAINNATTGTKALYEAAKKATEEAKKAWEAAPNDAAKKDAYEAALEEEENARQAYDGSVSNLETAEQYKEKLEKLYALVSSSTAELEKAVEDYNAAVLAAATETIDTFFAYYDAEKVASDLDAEVNAIEAVLYGRGENRITLYEYLIQIMGSVQTNNIYGIDENGYIYGIWIDMFSTMVTVNNGQINGALTIQALIEGLEAQKEALLAENEDYSAATTKENLIALKQAAIDGKTAVIEVLDIQLNEAKATLDAALKEYEAEEPAA